MTLAHHLSFALFGSRQRGGLLAVVAVVFAAGFAAGATLRPILMQHPIRTDMARASARDRDKVPASSPNPQFAYPADVLRTIDGDTFEARVHVWPGLEVSTKVRLRNVDAPELHARCADELAKAQAARAALETMLAAGGVTLSQVGIDKYGGRIDARVATDDVADVAAALLNGGFARSYAGGRRGSWC
jgi:endonuclease YncB( thermonuclease family)